MTLGNFIGQYGVRLQASEVMKLLVRVYASYINLPLDINGLRRRVFFPGFLDVLGGTIDADIVYLDIISLNHA